MCTEDDVVVFAYADAVHCDGCDNTEGRRPFNPWNTHNKTGSIVETKWLWAMSRVPLSEMDAMLAKARYHNVRDDVRALLHKYLEFSHMPDENRNRPLLAAMHDSPDVLLRVRTGSVALSLGGTMVVPDGSSAETLATDLLNAPVGAFLAAVGMALGFEGPEVQVGFFQPAVTAGAEHVSAELRCPRLGRTVPWSDSMFVSVLRAGEEAAEGPTYARVRHARSLASLASRSELFLQEQGVNPEIGFVFLSVAADPVQLNWWMGDRRAQLASQAIQESLSELDGDCGLEASDGEVRRRKDDVGLAFLMVSFTDNEAVHRRLQGSLSSTLSRVAQGSFGKIRVCRTPDGRRALGAVMPVGAHRVPGLSVKERMRAARIELVAALAPPLSAKDLSAADPARTEGRPNRELVHLLFRHGVLVVVAGGGAATAVDRDAAVASASPAEVADAALEVVRLTGYGDRVQAVVLLGRLGRLDGVQFLVHERNVSPTWDALHETAKVSDPSVVMWLVREGGAPCHAAAGLRAWLGRELAGDDWREYRFRSNLNLLEFLRVARSASKWVCSRSRKSVSEDASSHRIMANGRAWCTRCTRDAEEHDKESSPHTMVHGRRLLSERMISDENTTPLIG